MKTPHVHAELIKAWADGAQIEWYHEESNSWLQSPRMPSWYPDYEYRIKPEPKPDITVTVSIIRISNTAYIVAFRHNLKLVFDGETDELKSVEMIK